MLYNETNLINNTTSNETLNRANFTDSGSSGSVRGRGTSTGSGTSTGNGILPPCHRCFGHGVDPSIDPRCKFGCRGGGLPTGSGASTSLLPTTMMRFAFANMVADQTHGCTGKQNCPPPQNPKMADPKGIHMNGKDSASNRSKLRGDILWFCLGGLCTLSLAGLAIMLCRKAGCRKRQSRVGVAEVKVENRLKDSENI